MARQHADPTLQGSNAHSLLSFLLALLMHAGLGVLLFVGISWQQPQPEVVQAELWIPMEDLPSPEEVQQQAQPEPQPAPEPPAPAPTPAPKAAPAPEPEPTAAQQPDPAIAIAKAKEEAERKAAEARREEEKRRKAEEQARREREEAERRAAEEKQREEARKKQQEEARQRKLAEEKAAQEKAEKEKAARKAAEEKAVAEKAAAEKAAQQRKAAEARRKAAVSALLSQAGDAESTTVHGSTSGSRDAGYAARVSSAIRGNTTFTQYVSGNPQAVFDVRLSASGKVLDVKLKQSSGNGAWDSAAERAIRRTDPFPCPKTGSCETTLEIHHGPQD